MADGDETRVLFCRFVFPELTRLHLPHISTCEDLIHLSVRFKDTVGQTIVFGHLRLCWISDGTV